MKLTVLVLLACVATFSRCDTENNVIDDQLDDFSIGEKKKQNITNDESVSEVFENAVTAYLEENWEACINGFNEALHRYKTYKRMVVNCRRKCKIQAAGATPIFVEDIDDFHFYEKKVRETLCLLTCNEDYRDIAGSKAMHRLAPELQGKFDENRPYEYLHICYFQKKRYQDAANAVFTFLARQQGHELSVKNLHYYLTLPGVMESKVKNLENPPFVDIYTNGVMDYEDEHYDDAIDGFEMSLRSYLQSEEECRFYCEGPFNQGWFPEFTSSVANHFTYCLKCKRKCPLWLNKVNGEFRTDLLESHYNYLQFAYYKLGDLKSACEAVESFLLFKPADEIMLQNKEYYSSLPKVQPDYFKPREEAVRYVKRQEYERRLLRYIIDEFEAINARLNIAVEKQSLKEKNKVTISKDTMTVLHPPPGHSPSSEIYLTTNSSTSLKNQPPKSEESINGVIENKLSIVAREKELKGKNRYVADGFLNNTECSSIIKLADIAAVVGDGYDDHKSPHSIYEKFEGMTVGRAALMVYYGLMKPEFLELLLSKTENVREHVEKYFNLNRSLYFTYTHLVCRSALPDSPAERNDLSHEIHADNCILDTMGGCSTESPAYTWRDYSAILYLNSDFSGGEFFFAGRKSLRVESTVLPHCGRIVAFSAGGENAHAVKAVIKGRRCALALWFTLDDYHLEHERILASLILQRVLLAGPVKRNKNHIPLRYKHQLVTCFKEDEILISLLKEFDVN